MKRVLLTSAAALAMVASGLAVQPAQATGKHFVMVFGVLNNAFTPPLQQACADAEKTLGDTCKFMGPTENDTAAEVQMAQDAIQSGIDGIAVSAADPKAMVRALKLAKEKNVPVVTFNADVLPESAELRLTFVGTDNYGFGAELGRQAIALHPKGGNVCIESGPTASIDLNDRVQGVRDALAGVNRDHKVDRLTGQNGWTEASGCPVYNDDSVPKSVQLFADVLNGHPDLNAYVAVGGWAQYAPQAYKRAVDSQKARRVSKDLVLVFGDNFPPQMPLLKGGYSDVNVGQKPYDMAAASLKALHDFVVDGKKPEARVVTGQEVCLPAQADTCGKGQ